MTTTSKKRGIMCISLDTELLWGMHDVPTVDSYRENIINGREKAIPAMLDLFEKYDMHVTWAVVGGVMCANKEEFLENAPSENMYPSYENGILSSYRLIPEMGVDPKKDNLLFGKSIAGLIATRKHQYIGTHTFSHYYCTEKGQTVDQFEEDLIAAQKIAAANDIDVQSIVFPRNQINDEYLKVCASHGIKVYRGIEENWIYSMKQTFFQRIMRFADCYFSLSGPNTVTPKNECGVLNIRGSRILHPYNEKLKLLEVFKLHRIKGQMKAAAKKKQIFHLWWHPHNFGADLEKNLQLLESILRYYMLLKEKYGFISMAMEEIGALDGKETY